MKKVLFTVTVLLLVAAFAVSAFMVGNYLLEGKKQEDRFDELSNMVADARTEPTAGTDPEATLPAPVPVWDENGMLIEYKEPYAENSDLVGWLQLPGTEINYPVMQTPDDPEFYLKRNFDKEKSDWGCIFAWGTADLDEPSDNITLFGHNMRDGSMFAGLNAYVDKEAWNQNSLIIFNTLKEYHTYKIFAVFKTTASMGEGFSYHKFVDAKDEEAFDDFVSTCKDLAFYETGITPVYGDKLICLSTCEYSRENGRLVVAAVRIT